MNFERDSPFPYIKDYSSEIETENINNVYKETKKRTFQNIDHTIESEIPLKMNDLEGISGINEEKKFHKTKKKKTVEKFDGNLNYSSRIYNDEELTQKEDEINNSFSSESEGERTPTRNVEGKQMFEEEIEKKNENVEDFDLTISNEISSDKYENEKKDEKDDINFIRLITENSVTSGDSKFEDAYEEMFNFFTKIEEKPKKKKVYSNISQPKEKKMHNDDPEIYNDFSEWDLKKLAGSGAQRSFKNIIDVNDEKKDDLDQNFESLFPVDYNLCLREEQEGNMFQGLYDVRKRKSPKKLSKKQTDYMLWRVNCKWSKRARDRVKRIQDKKEKEIVNVCKFKPKVNVKSRKLAKGNWSVKKEKEFLRTKNEFIKRELFKKEEKEKFTPSKLCMSSKEIKNKIESFGKWQENKKDKCEKIRRSLNEKKLLECSFVPKVCKKTEKLFKKKKRKKRKDVFKRIYTVDFEKDKKRENWENILRYDKKKFNKKKAKLGSTMVDKYLNYEKKIKKLKKKKKPKIKPKMFDYHADFEEFDTKKFKKQQKKQLNLSKIEDINVPVGLLENLKALSTTLDKRLNKTKEI